MKLDKIFILYTREETTDERSLAISQTTLVYSDCIVLPLLTSIYSPQI